MTGTTILEAASPVEVVVAGVASALSKPGMGNADDNGDGGDSGDGDN